MKGRLLKASALACALFLFMVSSAAAQLRPAGTFYITPQVGLSDYYGDMDGSLFPNFDSEFPYYLGGELGYKISPTFEIGASYARANIPGAYENVYLTDPGENSGRHVGNLMLRYLFGGETSKVAFYLEGGIVGITGRPVTDDPSGDEESSFGIGASAGIGLDFVLAPQVSLMLGIRGNQGIPDEAVDGIGSGDPVTAGVPSEEGADISWDMVNVLPLVGLKIKFKSPFTNVMLTSIECPPQLTVGQSGTFAASVNADATAPVTYTWEFGDGATGSGMTSSHAFNSAGTYTASVTASNGRSTDTRSCSVNVAANPVGAEIVTVTADRMAFDVCEPVTVSFSANVRGDQPVTYSWDFGDGTQAMGSNVTHVFDEAGTFRVTLTASNQHGSDSESITIRAADCTSGICFEIEEMNCVYFERNSSTLTAEGRAALQENLEIFRECPNLGGRIEGWAAPGERNAQALSEDRARAVEQFYVDNGLAASRFTVVGMGSVTGVTSKKEGTSQYRRACTIPMQLNR